jgi:hypothetical protein
MLYDLILYCFLLCSSIPAQSDGYNNPPNISTKARCMKMLSKEAHCHRKEFQNEMSRAILFTNQINNYLQKYNTMSYISRQT